MFLNYIPLELFLFKAASTEFILNLKQSLILEWNVWSPNKALPSFLTVTTFFVQGINAANWIERTHENYAILFAFSSLTPLPKFHFGNGPGRKSEDERKKTRSGNNKFTGDFNISGWCCDTNRQYLWGQLIFIFADFQWSRYLQCEIKKIPFSEIKIKKKTFS